MRTCLSSFRGNLSFLTAATSFLFAAHAFASELLVSNNDDSGAGSLRQAILDNNALGGANTIVFSNVVTGTILLTSGELLVTKYVTILGPGPATLAVDGNATGRALHISGANNAVHAVISGLTLTNGGAALGGIYNDHATLTLTNCVVTGNRVGGIYNNGSVSQQRRDALSARQHDQQQYDRRKRRRYLQLWRPGQRVGVNRRQHPQRE